MPPTHFEYLERVRAFSNLNKIDAISIRLSELSLTTWDHFFSNLNSSAVILASKEAILLPLVTTLSGSKYTVLPEDEESWIIPLNLYYKDGRVKIQFAIAKGRKLWDKRNYKKEQDINREIDRSMKGKN